MNDFTKEELKLLFGGLQLWMEEILYEDEKDRTFRNELYKKIQSMIDNYCEHDCKLTIWQCQVTACSKCGFPSTLKVQGK